MSVINADDGEVMAKILEEKETFLFDCDGVIWSTGKLFPGAKETITKLQEKGKRVLYVTNNSTKTREQYLTKIQEMGLSAHLGDIFCTAFTSAQYLKKNLGQNNEVYVVGSPGLSAELEKAGIPHFGVGQDFEISGLDFDRSIPLNPRVTAVLAGFDGFFSYSKMTKAMSYLARKNSLFVVTNMDAQFPLKDSEYQLPGTGSIITSLITASARQPTVICGKPGSFMMDCIKAEVQFDPSRAIMLGDRLDTDILFGKNNSIHTMAVLSGVTSIEMLDALKRDESEESKRLLPDYFLESINDFTKYL